MLLSSVAARQGWRISGRTGYRAIELVLLFLLAVQFARLFWALVTPLGPVGDWRVPAEVASAPVSPAAFEGFDPFFRINGQPGPLVVTSLNLKLYGVREDRASGRGSAIVGLPDGQQRSFAVGEEIMPGVTLTKVGSDNVTISRGGAEEQIFIDQSAPAGSPAAPAAAPAAPPVTRLPEVVAPPRPPEPAARVGQ